MEISASKHQQHEAASILNQIDRPWSSKIELIRTGRWEGIIVKCWWNMFIYSPTSPNIAITILKKNIK